MKFGPVSVRKANGAILAHSISLGKIKFRKGRILSADDLVQLHDFGVTEVTVACLEQDDIHEDEAATILARAAAGNNIKPSAAFTGRVNLIAEKDGIAVLQASRVKAVNNIDEAITIATVSNYTVVRARQIIATVKVIPFAVFGASVRDAATRAAQDEPLVRIAPFQDLPVGLIQTQNHSVKSQILEKTARTIQDRLQSYGAHLECEIRCEHNVGEVSGALKKLLSMKCSPVLMIGASAIVDRRDIIPTAIEAAGGIVNRFGMPVDPGNLLLLAHHNKTPVIGAPGCARSPKFNGFDQILASLLSGVHVDHDSVSAMGAGGLLSEVSARPQPREGELSVPETPRIAALVLAGGMSSRTGKINKLLATLDNKAIVARVVDTLLASAADPVVVVTGHEAEAVQAALEGRNVTFSNNPRYAEGLSTSLQQGLTALKKMAAPVDGALFCLGDMPQLKTAQIDKLIAAFSPPDGRTICVPTSGGRRGNPVLWGRQFFSDIQEISGDVGARHLIGGSEELVCEVEMGDEAVLVDVDTPEALERVGALPPKSPT